MNGIVYNQGNFNQALSLADESVVYMNEVTSAASSIRTPADYSNSSNVQMVIAEIALNLKSSVDNLKTVLNSTLASMDQYEDLGKDSLSDLTSDDLGFLDEKYAEIYGLKSKTPAIDLSLFEAFESENGIYYKCTSDVVNAGFLSNRCDIYVTKNVELKAATIYFSGLGNENGKLFNDVFLRETIAKGQIRTEGIIIIPDDCYTGKGTAGEGNRTYAALNETQAKNIADSAKTIASSFGIPNNMINVYAFSAGGAIGTSLVAKNETGTFNTLIMASNCENLESVTDPNVRIISLVGASEPTNEVTDNSVKVQAAFAKYKETHINDVEEYMLYPTEAVPKVDHGHVSELSFTTEVFDGKTILDYAGTPEPSTQSATNSPMYDGGGSVSPK